MRLLRLAGRSCLVALAVLTCSACSRSERRPTEPNSVRPATPEHPTALVTARALFCAHGGVGMVPMPTPPDFEDHFAVVVFELDNPGPARPGLAVAGLDLVNDAGAPAAKLRAVKFVALMSATDRVPTPAEDGSWAYFLDSSTKPFDGTVPPGRTRLRVRVSLTGSGNPARYRLSLSGLGQPLIVEGPVQGSWPT